MFDMTQHNTPNRSFSRQLLAPLVLLAVALTIVLAGCSANQSRWNWDNLSFEGDYPAYYEDGQIISAIGIDVSSNQGEIDWAAVSESPVEFAMIRCGRRGSTEGNLYADAYFYQNADGAQSAGIPFGVYFFSQAITADEAREEADYVLNLIKGMDVSYPVAFDHETVGSADSRAAGLTDDELAQIALAFCSRIQEAGYETWIYGNQHDLSWLDLSGLDSEVWYAEYGVTRPTAEYNALLWQYSNEGSVPGIDAPADLNILLDAAEVQN